MVTIKCVNDTCPNALIETNFGGNPEFVECGGCHAHLEPYDGRDDPTPPIFLGDLTE